MTAYGELTETVNSTCTMMTKLSETAIAGIQLARYIRNNVEDVVAIEMANEVIRLARIVEGHRSTDSDSTKEER
jgi:hypothetical protein